MSDGLDKPATKLIVNVEKFRELAGARGFKNVDSMVEKAHELNMSLAMATVYRILGNGNFTKESLETLCQVVGIDLSDIVEFI